MEIFSQTIKREQDILAVRDRTRVICEEMGFTVPQQLQVNTSVFELGKNILEHGGGGSIHLSILTDEDNALTLQIEGIDHGPGFTEEQLEELLNSKASKNALRGIPAMKRLMDNISIESTPEDGTVVCLTKRKVTSKSISQNIADFFQNQFSSKKKRYTLSDELQLQNTNMAQTLSLYEEKNQELATKNQELTELKSQLETFNEELQMRSSELQEALLNLGDRTTELELNNRRFTAVLQAVEEGIVITDRSGQVCMVNAAFSNRMKLGEERICDKSSVDWRAYLGKFTTESSDVWNRMFTDIESHPTEVYDLSFQHPETESKISCRTKPIKGSDDMLYGRLWIFTQSLEPANVEPAS